MTPRYFEEMLKAKNFKRVDGTLISKDNRIKISLYPEGGFGSYYDGIWWESVEYEDDFMVVELTSQVVEDFGHPLY